MLKKIIMVQLVVLEYNQIHYIMQKLKLILQVVQMVQHQIIHQFILEVVVEEQAILQIVIKMVNLVY